jgi:glycosyltransferase involved in cell wall biosynthesis
MTAQRDKVLMVATSRTTKGGITAVLKAYENCPFWKTYQVRWLETHADGHLVVKLWWAVKAYIGALFLVPRYEIIHIHLSEVPSLMRKIMIFLYAKLWRKKIIVHFHSFSPESTINGRFRCVYLFVFKRADAVVVLSESWKKWMKQYLQIADNVSVIFNPCPDKVPVSGAKTNDILYAGALNQRKGYLDLIHAFMRIADDNPDWRLILAGNGGDEGKMLVDEADLSDRILFPGWVNGEQKAKLFSSASIFCLPSYAEGFPTAILEACSYGIAFITTPVGGIPDLVVDGENGLLFTPGDIDQLKDKLQFLITHADARERLGLAAHNMAIGVFSLQSTNKAIENLYNSLLNT